MSEWQDVRGRFFLQRNDLTIYGFEKSMTTFNTAVEVTTSKVAIMSFMATTTP